MEKHKQLKFHIPPANNAIIHINSARAYMLDIIFAVELKELHVEEAYHHLLAALRAVRKLKQQINN